MDRAALLRSFAWLTEDSGHTLHGLGDGMVWGMDRPTKTKPDLPSIVFLKGPADKYTLAELDLLHGFSTRVTVAYDRLFGIRRGCNGIVIDKVLGRAGDHVWLRKRMSWTMGAMHSATLPMIFPVFEADILLDRWAWIDDTAVQIADREFESIKIISADPRREPSTIYYYYTGLPDGGEPFKFHNREPEFVADTRQQLLAMVEYHKQELEGVKHARNLHHSC